MKFIGFIQEYDNVPFGIAVPRTIEQFENNIPIDVKKHIDNGVLVFSWMHYFNDINSGKPVAPHTYFTDGEWVWPSYFLYYLNRGVIFPKITEFFSFIESKVSIDISKEKLAEIERELVNLL